MTTPKTLTVTECNKLLDALLPENNMQTCYRKGLRNHVMALLMLDAGLRVGEVVALVMSDLYFDGKPVSSLTIRPGISKGKIERIIPLSDRIREFLAELHSECGHFPDLPPTAAVFHVFLNDKPLTTRQVERIIRAAAIRSIGRPVHPHVLRHTFATRLMRKTNARVVQELLGHKQMSSTQIYMNPNHEDLKKAIHEICESVQGEHLMITDSSLDSHAANRVKAPGTDKNHS